MNQEWYSMDQMDGPKNRFHLIKMFLFIKEDDSVIIWIVFQIINGPLKINGGVKQKSVNYCDFINKTFFPWYKILSSSF